MPRPRLRTQYNLHRTNSGRLASGMDKTEKDKRTPAIQVQNWPKALRSIVVADPGWVMIGADWRAIQFAMLMLRAAAIDEPHGFHLDLLDKQQAGTLDPHSFLAENFLRAKLLEAMGGSKTVEVGSRKAIRQMMKGYTYGRAFLGAPEVLAMEQGHAVALGRTVCDVHDKSFLLGHWQQFEIEQAVSRHFTETVRGFRRWFWESVVRGPDGTVKKPKPQEILGAVIQGDESELMKWMLGNVAEDLGPDFRSDEIEMLTTTHGSVLLQAREDKAEEAKRWLIEHMERKCPFLGGRGFVCEAKVGRTWKDVS